MVGVLIGVRASPFFLRPSFPECLVYFFISLFLSQSVLAHHETCPLRAWSLMCGLAPPFWDKDGGSLASVKEGLFSMTPVAGSGSKLIIINIVTF